MPKLFNKRDWSAPSNAVYLRRRASFFNDKAGDRPINWVLALMRPRFGLIGKIECEFTGYDPGCSCMSAQSKSDCPQKLAYS